MLNIIFQYLDAVTLFAIFCVGYLLGYMRGRIIGYTMSMNEQIDKLKRILARYGLHENL